jgi:hypothetical protein
LLSDAPAVQAAAKREAAAGPVRVECQVVVAQLEAVAAPEWVDASPAVARPGREVSEPPGALAVVV